MLTKLYQYILFYEVCEKKNNFVIDFKILRIFDVSVRLQPDFNKNFSCHALFVGNNNV